MWTKLRRSRKAVTVAEAFEYRLAPNVSLATMDGESRAMLLDARRGGRYYQLDELGARIWDQVAAGATIARIVDAIAAEYDAPREAVEADARGFLQRMLEFRVVVAA